MGLWLDIYVMVSPESCSAEVPLVLLLRQRSPKPEPAPFGKAQLYHWEGRSEDRMLVEMQSFLREGTQQGSGLME